MVMLVLHISIHSMLGDRQYVSLVHISIFELLLIHHLVQHQEIQH